jgi:hypothetical protein
MTTDPQTRSWVNWTIACAAAALVVLILSIQYARGSDFRKAAEWHKVHGDVILLDGHKLHLPQDWWERDPPTDEKRVVVKASKSLLEMRQTGIVVGRKGPNEMKADENGIRKSLEVMIEVENHGKQTPISSLVVLKAVSTKIYCKRATIVEPMVELRCDVVGAPTLITSVGLPNTEKDIEGIVATFE